MAVVVADLVAKIRADTSELQQGTQAATQQLKGVQQQAELTARALEIMAQKFVSSGQGGSTQSWLETFTRQGVQPTAAALSEAARQMEKTTAATVAAVAPSQAVARAVAEHAASAGTAAKAAQQVSDGWKLSESSLVRFGAGLAGINLGISLVAGAAGLVHDAIVGIFNTSLDWERSLVNLSGLYGDVGAKAAALAGAQANLPGVLGTQQEFASAAINASALTLRYGLPQRVTDQLVTTGGRVAFATGMTDPAERAALQAQLLAAVQTGAPLPARYGIYTDPEAVARSLGFQGAQSLQAFTPQELMQARGAIVSSGADAFANRAEANQRLALGTVTATAQRLAQTQSAIASNLEGPGTGFVQGPTAAERSLTQSILQYGQTTGPPAATPYAPAAANIQGLGAIDAEQRVIHAAEAYATALADSAKAQEDARRTLDELTHSVDATGAQLLRFFGSLEDTTSIAHGDILAQAQGAVTARARSAVPLFGMGASEIGALASGDAWQAAWQNFVAYQAQSSNTNVIQRNLQAQANAQGPGLEGSRGAAQRALDEATRTAPVYQAQREAQSRAALVDLQTADTQARLEAITLTQRERSLAMLRETVDLRKLDVQQQQIGLAATQNVIRAQQAAIPVQRTIAAAQFQQDMAQALSRQGLARLLTGGDVSSLPTVDQLIQQNFGGQIASAEAGPEAVTRAYAITRAQQPATAADLAQALTATQIRTEELKVDLANLSDLPQQTAIGTDLLQNNRDQLSVQTELRELMKKLVSIQSNQLMLPVPSDAADRRVPSAPSDLAGARHQ